MHGRRNIELQWVSFHPYGNDEFLSPAEREDALAYSYAINTFFIEISQRIPSYSRLDEEKAKAAMMRESLFRQQHMAPSPTTKPAASPLVQSGPSPDDEDPIKKYTVW